MSAFNIQWTATRQEQLIQEKYAHFFALVCQGKLLYIGLAHRENISEMIPSFILQNNLDPASLKVFLGRIKEYGRIPISPMQIKGVHDLLIFARKPSMNIAGRFVYQSNGDLKVANSGFGLLPDRLREENKVVFVSSTQASEAPLV